MSAVRRLIRRTAAESLYLLTAPVTAAIGVLAVLGGLCAGAVGVVAPGGSARVAGGLAPVRWSAEAERWRIAAVHAARTRPVRAGRRGRRTGAAAERPELLLDAAHAVAVVPVVLVTWVVTVMWWWVGLAGLTAGLRFRHAAGAAVRPSAVKAGSGHSYVTVSLGLTSPGARAAFGTVLGVVLLATLPLVTRLCTAAQTGLGQALLSDDSAVYRRIRGLERERDTARAQTAAAVSAEASALRRLERDIHDGPQQRLVRLAMELGRAQRHFDSRPDLVRAALADAVGQTREALEELRALSRGIAPPVLVDRGLHEALTALAARSAVPTDIDGDAPGRRLDAAVETAAYFVIAEALTNVAKHSRARRCTVGLRHEERALRVWVADDGVGGAALSKGHGLRGLEDRLYAVGGVLEVASPAGGPTTIEAVLPCC